MHNCNMHANIMSSQYGESMFDAEEKTDIYTDEPTKFDILCGRDKLSFNNAGNIRFRSVVILNLQKYKMSECKFERSRVVDGIKGELQKTGGRFLKFDRKARRWNKLSGREISDKISHALRDKHPPMISAKLKTGKAPLFKLRMTPVNSGTSTLIQKGATSKLSSSTNRDYTSTSEERYRYNRIIHSEKRIFTSFKFSTSAQTIICAPSHRTKFCCYSKDAKECAIHQTHFIQRSSFFRISERFVGVC